MEKMEVNLQQAPASRRRVQPLERPVVYEPTVSSFAKPKVKPISYEEESKQKDHYFLLGFMIVGALLGIVAGIMVRALPGGSYKLDYILNYGSGGMTVHCLIYGAVLGALEALILYPVYSRLKHVLPVYVCFLFLPILLLALSPLLSGLTELLFAAVKVVLGLLGVVVVIAIVWGWLFG